jgi:hypothetical protein
MLAPREINQSAWPEYEVQSLQKTAGFDSSSLRGVRAAFNSHLLEWLVEVMV